MFKFTFAFNRNKVVAKSVKEVEEEKSLLMLSKKNTTKNGNNRPKCTFQPPT